MKRSNGTVLKNFVYDSCTGTNNWCNGKLVKAEHTNFPRIGATTYTVVIGETYTYGGRDGRVSQRDTQMTLNGSASESFTQAFTYFHLGQPQTIGYPQCTHTGCAGTAAAAARTVQNTFSEGLLSNVKVGTLTYGTLSYHPNLLVNQVTHANGVVETQSLDANNMARPAAFNAKLGTTTLWSSGTYVYDGAGNVTKTGSAWYLYDKVSRLLSSNLYDGTTGAGTLKTQSYTFDPFGNMTAIGGTSARNTPTSATTNRLTGTGIVYDARGNLINWNGATYEFDDFNLMHHMTSGAEEWLYVYTADDERIWLKKIGTGIAKWTVRDLDGKVLREYAQDTAGWTIAEDYIYRNGQLLAGETPAGRKHYHLDHLGTPRLITNASGQTLAYHLYYPFGEEATTFNQDTERMKFTGHERDLASTAGAGDDLDYMHARFCSPVTGRFLSVDRAPGKPVIPQSWNRYAYAFDNPIRYLDPNGQEGLQFSDYGEATFEALGQTVDQIAFAVASPYFHFREGVMNDDPAELAKAGGEIAVDALGGVALKEGAYAFRVGWTSRANLLKHFEKHGGRLGFKVVESYAMAAKNLASAAGQEGIESIVLKNGDKMVFNKSTLELVLVNKEGRIVTYFRSTLKYWAKRLREAAAAAAR